MSEEKKTESVDNAGSSADLIKTDPAKSAAGESVDTGAQTNETKDTGEETVAKSQYEELESKLGEQGNELGKYRDFFKEVEPLLGELDKQPELVQAIVDGKLDSNLIKAALEGKVTVQEAKTVSEAHKEVKDKLGDKKYEKTSSEDISKLVADKIAEATKGIKDEFNKNISEVENMREFEGRINDFIKNTDDFKDYAVDIDKWFAENPEQDDIKVAYNAVKGAALIKKADETKGVTDAEANKDAAANAAGGASTATQILEDKEVVDKLISDKSNPNMF